MISRPIEHRYTDPLALVWIRCAEAIGFHIQRSDSVYASYDGKQTLIIGSDATLDPDDSLAQMIFHELCHALVQGDAGLTAVDWGLDNMTHRDRWREHACLRLQAYLAGAYGLREFFAPTTDFRVSFWNDLPADPFAAGRPGLGRREPSCVLARVGAWRATQPRWQPHLDASLRATAEIAESVTRASAANRAHTPVVKPEGDAMPSLWDSPRPPEKVHPAGHATVAGHFPMQGCRTCAWGYRYRRTLKCRHNPEANLSLDAPACLRWEPAGELDCASCGACCREAYHSVELDTRERVVRQRPDLIVTERDRLKLRRTGSKCAALQGGETPDCSFACEIYAIRPATCRDFMRGGVNCLDARRRVGLSL